VFAIGNLVHPAETADVCALDGRHVAGAVADWLSSEQWTDGAVTLRVAGDLRWVSPSMVVIGHDLSRDRVLLRTSSFIGHARVEVRQGDRLVWSGRLRGSGVPTRTAWIPAAALAQVDPAGGPVTISG
jgi:hypothetical protein